MFFSQSPKIQNKKSWTPKMFFGNKKFWPKIGKKLSNGNHTVMRFLQKLFCDFNYVRLFLNAGPDRNRKWFNVVFPFRVLWEKHINWNFRQVLDSFIEIIINKKYLPKIQVVVKKWKLFKKIKNFSAKIELLKENQIILVKNRTFGQKTKFCSKIEELAQKRNFSKQSMFCSKI